MLKYRNLGFILVGISVFFLISLIIFQIQVNGLISELMISSGGFCVIDGKCIHESNNIPVYIGGAISFITLALSLYLILFERSQEYAEKTHKEIVQNLKDVKKKQDFNEKFEFLLKALDEDEKKVMKSIKEQDGVTQSTLRIRTDLSKTKLSVVLSGLEKKSLIKKVPEGKKNRIYLKSVF